MTDETKEAIREWIKRNDISRKCLAAALGIHPQTIANVVANGFRSPNVKASIWATIRVWDAETIEKAEKGEFVEQLVIRKDLREKERREPERIRKSKPNFPKKPITKNMRRRTRCWIDSTGYHEETGLIW